MSALAFRMAAPGDAEGLARLNAQFNGEGLASAETARAALAAGGSERVAVCEAEGALVAFACAQLRRSFCYREPAAEITEVFVEPGFRRRGVARRLIALLEAECARGGAKEFAILTGRDNAAAQALYRALGYAESGEIVFFKASGG